MIQAEATTVSTEPVTGGASRAERTRMKVESYGLTDRGRSRPSNEDQFLIAELTKRMHIVQSSLEGSGQLAADEVGHLLVVADGMGGHQAGEQASALAVQTVEDFMLNALQWFFHLRSPEGGSILTDFQQAVRQADARIYEKAMEHPDWRGMGTTLTLAFALGEELFVAHAGDSRAYLWRDGALHRLTRDHTLVEEMLQRGALTPEQAAHHRLRHVITNALGGESEGVRVEVHRLGLQAGDVVLLCSDGLTEMLPEDRIASFLRADSTAENACRRLISAANEAGGRDNITVVVARFGPAD